MSDGKGYKITELGMCQCRFPITPHNAPSHRFCGNYAANHLKPWCEEHWPVVFDQRPLRQRQEAATTAIASYKQHKFLA